MTAQQGKRETRATSNLPPLAPHNLGRGEQNFCVVTDSEAEGGDVLLTFEQAAEIIRRVNAHDTILAILEEARQVAVIHKLPQFEGRVNSAIAKAKGDESALSRSRQ